MLGVSGDDGVLTRLSYDLQFAFRRAAAPQDCVMVLMDENSHQEFNQIWGQMWDRSLHARLLERLTRDGARLVIFDIWLAQQGPKENDQRLAQAIRNNGKVILAAELTRQTQPGIAEFSSIVPPVKAFAEAALGWGLAKVGPDPDLGARRFHPGTETCPSLAWTAAVAAGASLINTSSVWTQERWLNYYGPADTVANISYVEALRQPAGFFTNKCVIIGGKPSTRYSAEEIDEFRIPSTHWDGRFCSGVEVMATSFLNLLNHDWLERLAPWKESLLVLLCGCIAGFGLIRFRPAWATILALSGMLVVAAVAMLSAHFHVWFVWMVIVAVQIPCAWVCANVSSHLTARRIVTEAPGLAPPPPKLTTAQPGSTMVLPVVPDHNLLLPIGKGAYGEVWLARNVIGLYRAVKVVYRGSRGGLEAYEREFNGIRNFMPVSLNYPGLLHVLHVGRNDEAGYYYCVMEAGDDESAGQKIDPAKYSARNLHRELNRLGRLTIGQCVDLGLALTMALEYLHSQQLIHRDIKPSNIIFVNSVPKLADIGLVTEIDRTDMSIVGTPDFMDRRHPGTVAADLYALGKVLYMAGTGLPPGDFPTLPTGWEQWPQTGQFLQLNEIIAKACQPDLSERYQSAAEIRADLANLRASMDLQSRA
jgi:CHASE2 domain-containing sensor protein